MDKKALDIINEYQSFTPEQIKENTSKIIENIEDPEVKSLVVSFVIFTGMNSRNPTVRELIEFNSSQRSPLTLKQKVTNLVNKYRVYSMQHILENSNIIQYDITDPEEMNLFNEFVMYIRHNSRMPSTDALFQIYNTHYNRKGGTKRKISSKRRRLRRSKKRLRKSKRRK